MNEKLVKAIRRRAREQARLIELATEKSRELARVTRNPPAIVITSSLLGDLEQLVRRLQFGEVVACEETRALARAVIERRREREDEDVREWAERLAGEVAHLTD